MSRLSSPARRARASTLSPAAGGAGCRSGADGAPFATRSRRRRAGRRSSRHRRTPRSRRARAPARGRVAPKGGGNRVAFDRIFPEALARTERVDDDVRRYGRLCSRSSRKPAATCAKPKTWRAARGQGLRPPLGARDRLAQRDERRARRERDGARGRPRRTSPGTGRAATLDLGVPTPEELAAPLRGSPAPRPRRRQAARTCRRADQVPSSKSRPECRDAS